jgi:thioredoxin reductase (NADPH)
MIRTLEASICYGGLSLNRPRAFDRAIPAFCRFGFPVRKVVVYSRRGCHLCEEMIEQIEPLCRGLASLEVADVDLDPPLREAFGLDVPVLMVDEREVCRHRLDLSAFKTALNSL